MAQKKGWMERFADGADLPGEALPGQPLVELAGERRVLIENHQGVTEYDTNKICVRMRYGYAAVHGCGLELIRMTKNQLVICGRIDGVSLLRRGC